MLSDLGGSVVKNPPAKTGNTRDEGSIPGSGRCPGVGNGNPLQYSCLENPIDRGAWRATVQGIRKTQIRLTNTHTQKSDEEVLYVLVTVLNHKSNKISSGSLSEEFLNSIQ